MQPGTLRLVLGKGSWRHDFGLAKDVGRRFYWGSIVMALFPYPVPSGFPIPTMRCCQPLDVYGVASAPVWAVAELGRWDFTEGILDRTRIGLL